MQYYKTIKSFVIDQQNIVQTNDMVYYPGNKSLHFLTNPIQKPGFYLISMSKYGLVSQTPGLNNYLFTDKIAKDPLNLNFTVSDCEIPDQNNYFSSLIDNFTMTGIGIAKSTYTVYDSELVEHTITMWTHEIYAEMYIMDSPLTECNFYVPLFGVKKTDVLKVWVDKFNDTSFRVVGLKIPPKCQQGNLYINLTLKRVIYDVSNQIKLVKYVSREGILAGGFNCNSSCLECNLDSLGCLSCPLGFLLDSGKFCVPSCPFTRPLMAFENYFSPANSTNQTRPVCRASCDQSFYLDKAKGSCQACFQSCSSCNGRFPNDCLSCTKDLYFYKGFCLTSCPQLTLPDNNPLLLKCVETQSGNSGTLNLTILDSSFNNFFEEDDNFKLSGAVSYDGSFDVTLRWSLVVQGVNELTYNELQTQTFISDNLRKNTLTVAINIMDIANYQAIREDMVIELLGQAGTEYKAEYLNFVMRPKPVPVSMTPVLNTVTQNSTFQISLDVNFNVQGVLISFVCYMSQPTGKYMTIFEKNDLKSNTLSVYTGLVPVFGQDAPNQEQNITCSFFGSNMTQEIFSTSLSILRQNLTHKELMELNLQRIWDFTSIITKADYYNFIGLAQNLAYLTSGNPNPENLCVSDYECFGNGQCVKSLSDARYCSCKSTTKGLNCQFKIAEFEKLNDLFSQAFTFIKISASNETTYSRFEIVNILSTLTQLLKFKEFLGIQDIKFCVYYLDTLTGDSPQVSSSMLRTMSDFNMQIVLEFVDEIINSIGYKAKIALNVMDWDVPDESNKIRQTLASNLLRDYHKRVKSWLDKLMDRIIPNFLPRSGESIFETRNLMVSMTTQTRSAWEGSMLSSSQLLQSNSFYIPGGALSAFYHKLRTYSPVTVGVLEWRNNMFHLDPMNSNKVLSNTKSVAIFDSNGTRFDDMSIKARFEFSVVPLTFSKVSVLVDTVLRRCKQHPVWQMG